MQKEIRFRTWDKEYEMWLQSFEWPIGHSGLWMDIDTGHLIHIEPDGDNDIKYDVHRLEDVFLCQFTGLKDIAGTDCYEGDIVKAVWSEDINDELHGIGKVIFNCGCFMIEWISDPESNMELLGMIYKTGRPRVFQILGNIFQHPELIKSK